MLILCTGGAGVIRKEAWPFYGTISGVRLSWELEEPKGPKWAPLQREAFINRAPRGVIHRALRGVVLRGVRSAVLALVVRQ